ncbi:MAG: YaaA family protein [Actinocrinis sp.]
MYIFIPPSEGKSFPTGPGPVDLANLSVPELTKVRKSLLNAVIKVSEGAPPRALAALGLSNGQRDELTHNQTLATAPTGPAAEVYSGVLYEALDLPGMRATEPEAYRRAQDAVLVFSGLWGVVRPEDRIPYYRCSGATKLPRIGAVTTVWKKALAVPLTRLVADDLVVDLRSSSYTGMWRPTGDAAKGRTVAIRVLHERIVGGVLKRTVVSHFNKATKGRLVRAVLLSGAEPKTPDEFADTLRDLGHRVEPSSSAGAPGASAAYDVIVSEI